MYTKVQQFKTRTYGFKSYLGPLFSSVKMGPQDKFEFETPALGLLLGPSVKSMMTNLLIGRSVSDIIFPIRTIRKIFVNVNNGLIKNWLNGRSTVQ